MYKKVLCNGYILGVGIVAQGGNISKEEYDTLTAVFNNAPECEVGYYYRLKENLVWELCEVPAIDDEPASIEDYEEALRRFGV